MQSPVVLINVFSVPKGEEEVFLNVWTAALELMKNEPGLIEAKLHRSLDLEARFQFINVAQWESSQAWEAAFSKPELKAIASQATFEQNPALYKVEVQS